MIVSASRHCIFLGALFLLDLAEPDSSHGQAVHSVFFNLVERLPLVSFLNPYGEGAAFLAYHYGISWCGRLRQDNLLREELQTCG
mgnify:CR=1 FL=1